MSVCRDNESALAMGSNSLLYSTMPKPGVQKSKSSMKNVMSNYLKMPSSKLYPDFI